MSNDTAKFRIEADPSPYEAAMARAVEVTTETVSQIKERFESINEAIGLVSEAFVGLTAAFAGGEAMKEFVDTAVNVGFGAEEMGRMFGIGATAASRLKVALGDVYLTQDQFQTVASRLVKQLETNESYFTRLGIATRNTDGSFRSITDIILAVNDRLAQLKEGTDRNVAAAQLYGKQWMQSADVMRLTSSMMEEAKVHADALGLTVGVESVNRAYAYKTAMNNVHEVVEAVSNAIGQALMPVLTAAGNWFSVIGPGAVEATRATVDTLAVGFGALWDVVSSVIHDIGELLHDLVGDVAGSVGPSVTNLEVFENVLREIEVAFTLLKTTVTVVLESVMYLIEELIDWLKLLGTIAADVMTLRWGRITSDWNSGFQQIEDDAQRHLNNIADAVRKAGATMQDELTKSFAPPKEETLKPSSSGQKNTVNRGSVYTQLEAELQLKEAAWAEENAAHGKFIDFSKEQELEFWQSKLHTVNQGTTEYTEIQQKIGELTMQVARQNFQNQLAQLKEEEAAAEQDYTKKLELAKEYAARVATAYGADSKEYAAAQQEILAIEKKMTDQRKAIALEAAKTNDQLALNDVDAQLRAAQEQVAIGTETKSELLAQEAAFEDRKYAIKRAAIQRELAIEDNPTNVAKLYDQLEILEQQHQDALSTIQRQAVQERDRLWEASAKKMETSFNSSILQMLNGTRTFTQTVRSLMQSLASGLINMALQIAEEWIAKEVMKLIASKTTAAGQVQAQAGVAGASGTASFAGAPWPIDLGAPAFGAAMLATAQSYGAVAAAESGYDVPSGVNPVTQLHQKEMVLPEDLAEGARQTFKRGGGGDTYHVHISAMDSSSFHDYIHQKSNQSALVDTLQHAHSRGRRS